MKDGSTSSMMRSSPYRTSKRHPGEAEDLDVGTEPFASDLLELGGDADRPALPDDALGLGEDIAPFIPLSEVEVQVTVLVTEFGNLGSHPDGVGQTVIDDSLDPSQEFGEGDALLRLNLRGLAWLSVFVQNAFREPPLEVFEVGAGRGVPRPILGVPACAERLGFLLLRVVDFEVDAG